MKTTSTIIQIHFLYENNNSHADIVTEPILGKLIGEGSTAEVFEDVNDSSTLYKKYDVAVKPHHEVLEMARKESDLFNAFYGDDVYLRMLHVRGTFLREIDTADIPNNLESLYL